MKSEKDIQEYLDDQTYGLIHNVKTETVMHDRQGFIAALRWVLEIDT